APGTEYSAGWRKAASPRQSPAPPAAHSAMRRLAARLRWPTPGAATPRFVPDISTNARHHAPFAGNLCRAPRSFLSTGSDFGRAAAAAAATTKLITQNNVLAVIGPNASRNAIPAAIVANNLRTPMISPWLTSVEMTVDRPCVFW